MKSPRLIRPMMMLGIFVLVLAVLSFATLPGWRSSAWGVILLVVGILLGLAAVVKDLTALVREIRQVEDEQKTDKKD